MGDPIVVVDLDGTCVRYEPRFEVEPCFLDYLAPWMERGVRWAMNSDRPPEHMEELALAIDPPRRPFALLSRQRDIFFLHNGAYRPHEEYNAGRRSLHAALWDELRPHAVDWEKEVRDRFTVLESYVSTDTFAFMTPPEESPVLRALLAEYIAPYPDAAVSGNADWTFLLHAAFSKGELLRELARAEGLDPADFIAVGDGYNDVSMLDGTVTPRVGCPENACDEVRDAVRRAGGRHAPGEAAAGTVAVIDHFLAGDAR